ncbi:mitochondrial carrier [Serendipita vermifera]|nr:mitochondrial carrier [Serendipita vermifera]
MDGYDPLEPPKKPDLDPTVDFAAGTVAGLTSLFVGFPFDTVKVRFQDPNTAARYTSTSDALMTIVKEERVSGLYKGIQAPMLGCAILNGIVFGTYGFLMRAQLTKDQKEPSLLQTFISGAGTGVISSTITAPTELIKIRQQSVLGSQVPTVWEIAREIYQSKGIPGLYRGYMATAFRELGYGFYFLTYEAVSRSFRRRRESPTSSEQSGSLAREAHVELAAVPWYGVLLAGALAGPASWIATFPADVIKTRMQTPSSPPAIGAPGSLSKAIVIRERTMLETALYCYRKEGARTFFAGLAPTMIRAVPVNVCTFATFELVVGWLTK